MVMADDSFEMSVWVTRGSMMYNRECLDWDDPDHPYNYIKSNGARPEDYGYYLPVCPCCGIQADEAKAKNIARSYRRSFYEES
jgi:hypothetical protein